MSWEARYQKGSFRGVAFNTKDDSLRGGRRTVLHEYPMRDVPYAQDLGRKARRYQINAVLVGDDYMDRRDALIGALETEGPGLLVHPYYGQLMVVLDGDYSVNQTTADGGMCTVGCTFVDAGDNVFPAGAAAMSNSLAIDSTAAAKVSGLPEVVRKNFLEQLLDNAESWLDKIAGSIPTIPDSVYQVLGKINTISNKVAGLIRRPLNLILQVQAI